MNIKILNRAFSLIEIILYVSLLSLIMIGIFSTLVSSIQSKHTTVPISEDSYRLLIQNFHE
jgi:type II secretory pathway component PulJ